MHRRITLIVYLVLGLCGVSFAQQPHTLRGLDIGTKEGRDSAETGPTVDGARLLKITLIRKGWKEGTDLKYFEADGAEHNEKA